MKKKNIFWNFFHRKRKKEKKVIQIQIPREKIEQLKPILNDDAIIEKKQVIEPLEQDSSPRLSFPKKPNKKEEKEKIDITIKQRDDKPIVDEIKKEEPLQEQEIITDIEEKKLEIILEEQEQLDLPVDDISKNTIVTNDINLKIDILDEIDEMLKTKYHEIAKIKYELEILESQEKDDLTKKEIEILEEELNKLIRQFEMLKKEFYQQNYQNLLDHVNNKDYIEHLMDEYKILFQNGNEKESTILQIKAIEKYINVIDEIIDIENKSSHLEDKVQTKKEQLNIHEDEFDKLKEDYVHIDRINQQIDSFTKNQESIIKSLEEKMRTAETVTKKAEYKSELVFDISKLLKATLLLATSSIVPPTRSGNLLKAGLLIAGIGNLASLYRVQTKENKVTTKVTYVDYERDILKNITDIQDMNLMADKAILDIKNLKKEFLKEFSEYADVLPDYWEMLMNLDNVEKELKVKKNIAQEFDKKMHQNLEQNNVKVKRLEEEYLN